MHTEQMLGVSFTYDAEARRSQTLTAMPGALRNADLDPNSFLGSANYFARECHLAALKWYVDLNTGEDKQMNTGERLMLAVSEACEAQEGYDLDRKDDKLPQYEMLHVEIADFAIRLFDNCGYQRWNMKQTINAVLLAKTPIFGSTNDVESMLFGMVRHLSAAMEGDRKNKMIDVHAGETGHVMPVIQYEHARALIATSNLAMRLRTPLVKIIQEKMAFNSVRPDHKLENRQKGDGVKY